MLCLTSQPLAHLHCRPKPNHYLEWLRTGNCSFGDMCSLVSEAVASRASLGKAQDRGSSFACHAALPACLDGGPPPLACCCMSSGHWHKPDPVQGIYGDGTGGLGRGGGGLCKYVAEYCQYVPEWTVMHRLDRLCSNLLAGTWHPKF